MTLNITLNEIWNLKTPFFVWLNVFLIQLGSSMDRPEARPVAPMILVFFMGLWNLLNFWSHRKARWRKGCQLLPYYNQPIWANLKTKGGQIFWGLVGISFEFFLEMTCCGMIYLIQKDELMKIWYFWRTLNFFAETR